MKAKDLTELAEKLSAALPENFKAARDDCADVFRSSLENQLAKFDLVTREEFDVQKSVLRRTREKLEALEQRLSVKNNTN